MIRPAYVAAVATSLKLVGHLSLGVGDRRFEEALAAAAIAPYWRGLLRLLLLLLGHSTLPVRRCNMTDG
jgi:hypothetical protein